METESVTIYTDGACLGNPGQGGYAAVLLCGEDRKEMFAGYRLTTNNRMELTAAIVALQALGRRSSIKLHTDSKYLADSINFGWAKRWRDNAWKTRNGKRVNWDLWTCLLDLCTQHDVDFIWVRGHAGDIENEHCDALSLQAAQHNDLPADVGYEERLLDSSETETLLKGGAPSRRACRC